MADGTEIMVIARARPGEDGTFTLPTPLNTDEIRQRAYNGESIGMLIHGKHDDGCLWFLHLHSTPPPDA